MRYSMSSTRLLEPAPWRLHALDIVGMNCREERLEPGRHGARLVAEDAIEFVATRSAERRPGRPDEPAETGDALDLGEQRPRGNAPLHPLPLDRCSTRASPDRTRVSVSS